LRQRLNNNPDWAAPQTDGAMGYLSGSILIGDGTSMTMQYMPSAGNSAQTIVTATNNTGTYATYADTIQLEEADNPQTGAVGYVDILINILNVSTVSKVSNIQVIQLQNNITGVLYDETPVNRQVDQMFNYYNDLLQAKPIPSYLECWDFPLNPAQFLSRGVAAQAVGANKSYYGWDQTIIFQSADSGVALTDNQEGALVVTSSPVAGTQLALIQYQESDRAREILNSRLSVMVRAHASTSIDCTVSLWYTTGATLPVLTAGTNNSLVATLDANGKPATFNLAGGVTWTEVPRLPKSSGTTSMQDAQFTIGTATQFSMNEYPFSGRDLGAVAAVGTATFFAIVVGTELMAQNATISFESISLVPGDIPTRPAPQSYGAVLMDAQRYYEKSFAQGVVPANSIGTTYLSEQQITGASTATRLTSYSYKAVKRAAPSMTFYNPVNNNAQAHNINQAADCSATTVGLNTDSSFAVAFTTGAGTTTNETNAVNWVSDARLGIV